MKAGTVVRHAQQELALSLPGIDPRTRAMHHARMAHHLMLAGDAEQARPLAYQALAEIREQPDPETAVIARLVLAGIYVAGGAGGIASAVIDAMLRQKSGNPAAPGDVLMAGLLHCLGRGGEGGPMLTACMLQARREHSRALLALATQVSGQVNLTTGNLARARAEIGSADAGYDHGMTATLRMVSTAALALHLDDDGLIRNAISAAQTLRSADCAAERRWATRVLALAPFQREDAPHFCRLLAHDPLLPASPPMPYDITFLVFAARAAISAPDHELLERIAAVAATLTGGDAAPAFLAGADHVRALVDADPSGLLTAANLQTAADRPLLAAAATEDAGRLLLDRGKSEGIQRLNEAFGSYAAAGAVADCKRVGRLLRAQGTHRRSGPRHLRTGWESLTGAELSVVRVVAAGATTREAAEKLYLSPHTVNTHVRHTFTKLGINSRVELANMVRDNDG